MFNHMFKHYRLQFQFGFLVEMSTFTISINMISPRYMSNRQPYIVGYSPFPNLTSYLTTCTGVVLPISRTYETAVMLFTNN